MCSFHVGSGAKNPTAFADAIAQARVVFDAGTARGFHLRVLDLGGGFTAGDRDAAGGALGTAIPAAINAALVRGRDLRCNFRSTGEHVEPVKHSPRRLLRWML